MLSLNPAILTLYEEDYETTSPDLVSLQTFIWLQVDTLRHSGHILATWALCVWSRSRSWRWTRILWTSSPTKECIALDGWSPNPSGKKNTAPQVPCPLLHRRRGCWAARCSGQPCGRMGHEDRRRVRRWWNPDPVMEGPQCHLRFLLDSSRACVGHQHVSTHMQSEIGSTGFACAVLHRNPPTLCRLLRLEVDHH